MASRLLPSSLLPDPGLLVRSVRPHILREDLPVDLMTDASALVWAVVLEQRKKPLAFPPGKFNATQRSWAMMDGKQPSGADMGWGWAVRIHRYAVRFGQCAGDLPGHDKPHL